MRSPVYPDAEEGVEALATVGRGWMEFDGRSRLDILDLERCCLLPDLARARPRSFPRYTTAATHPCAGGNR